VIVGRFGFIVRMDKHTHTHTDADERLTHVGVSNDEVKIKLTFVNDHSSRLLQR